MSYFAGKENEQDNFNNNEDIVEMMATITPGERVPTPVHTSTLATPPPPYIGGAGADTSKAETLRSSEIITNPAIIHSNHLKSYSLLSKYTLYSTLTNLLQSDTDLPTLLSHLRPSNGNMMTTEETVSGINVKQQYTTTNTIFWLDVLAPENTQFSELAQQFNIHPLTIEDIMMRDSREKCEIFERYLFICIHPTDQSSMISNPTIGENIGDIMTFPTDKEIIESNDDIIADHNKVQQRRKNNVQTRTADHVVLSMTEQSSTFGGVETGGNNNQHSHNVPNYYDTLLYLILFPTHLISIHHTPLPHIRRVLRRLYGILGNSNNNGSSISRIGSDHTLHSWILTPDWILYNILDDIVDEFQPTLQKLQLEVDTIDELVLFLTHTEQNDMLRRIGRARKRVTSLLRLLKPKTDILKMLTSNNYTVIINSNDHSSNLVNIDDDNNNLIGPKSTVTNVTLFRTHTIVYLRDVMDHVLTCLQNLDSYQETLNRSHSNYLAQISIELNEASNRMNVVMKKLTAAAALVLPLSLISSIWGMNVPVPGQEGITRLIELMPFGIIVVIMGIIMAVMFWLGRRNDWW